MRTTNKSRAIIVVLIFLLVIYIYNILPSVISWGPSGNYENYSARTQVNVTQAYPEILNISCNNKIDITLNGGSYYTVDCLVEVLDYNGGNSINYANGTFYYYLNESSDSDDNNTHYTNSSCTETSTGGYYTNWTCSFDVWYYANNGTWEANITVNDSYGFKVNDYGNTTILPLYALNVTSLIDFGDMAVGDTSATPVEANVTNFGNVDINVSVYGFGGNNSITGTGFAMLCSNRNITLPNERYSINIGDGYAAMTPITGVATYVPGLKILHQIDDTQKEINSTYWRLHINLTTNPFGICNGTVVFAAEAP